MFGFTLVQKKYLDYMEHEVLYYRIRAEEERARADRANDGLLQMLGQLPTSDTVITERKTESERIEDMWKKREEETREIFAESMEVASPEELKKSQDFWFGIEIPEETAGEKAMTA